MCSPSQARFFEHPCSFLGVRGASGAAVELRARMAPGLRDRVCRREAALHSMPQQNPSRCTPDAPGPSGFFNKKKPPCLVPQRAQLLGFCSRPEPRQHRDLRALWSHVHGRWAMKQLNRAGRAQEKYGRNFTDSIQSRSRLKNLRRGKVTEEFRTMNFIKNIWNHPKTSAAGLLIAVASVAGVLSQQGISLGKVGTGTAVSLASALATALLGLMAKDPSSATSPATNSPSGASSGATSGVSVRQQAKLGAWMLIALMLPLPWMQGCTAAGVAEDIVNWTPPLQSAVATVDSTAALLAPADAPIFAAATIGFDAASNLLVAQAKAYLANPSASVLAQLQNQIVTFQQQVNTALLQAAKIVNANSQQHALAAIRGRGHNCRRDSVAGANHLKQSAGGADGIGIQRQICSGRALSE